MEPSNIRIGFVGVGRMGANMARRLHDLGYHIMAVHDRRQETAAALGKELHCVAATRPSHVAERSDIVVTVVSDDDAMREIFHQQNPASLMVHAKGRLFINCATVTPAIHVEIERHTEQHGGSSLEACMAGSIAQARQGSLYFLCGGRVEVFARARPVLEALGSTVRYIGPAGVAAKVKILINMVMNSNTAALAEGLGLGAALGIDLTLLREVFSQTGAASRVLDTDGEDMQHRSHECYFSAAHAAKDSSIALQIAKDLRLSLPVAESALGQYRRLIELEKGELDKSAVSELTFKGRSQPLP
jgi:3-hydroxyisobutyrate dehydrogenase-like beta-hydroxyacid dehydrogenase